MGNFQSFGRAKLRLVILGLDCAGKSTILYRFKKNQFIQANPTIGFNCERVTAQQGKLKGISMEIWDVGGQDKIRPLWSHYLRSSDGLIFVIDLSDTERLEEARLELLRILKQPDYGQLPVMVLLNKMDLPGSMDPQQAERILDLKELTRLNIDFSVVPTCGVNGEGLDIGMEQLYKMIQDRRLRQKNSKSVAKSKARGIKGRGLYAR